MGYSIRPMLLKVCFDQRYNSIESLTVDVATFEGSIELDYLSLSFHGDKMLRQKDNVYCQEYASP